jgi:hypothetical protein
MFRDLEDRRTLAPRPNIPQKEPIKIDILHRPMIARELEFISYVQLQTMKVDHLIGQRRHISIQLIVENYVRPDSSCSRYLADVRDLVADTLIHKKARQSRHFTKKDIAFFSESTLKRIVSEFKHPSTKHRVAAACPVHRSHNEIEHCPSQVESYLG